MLYHSGLLSVFGLIPDKSIFSVDNSNFGRTMDEFYPLIRDLSKVIRSLSSQVPILF